MSTAGLPVAEANNFLLPESHMAELLKSALADMSPAVHILTSSDLDGVDESKQRTPAVHLIYGGFRVTGKSGNSWSLQHTWWAVAAVRSAATIRSGKQARQDAGVLWERMTNALAGKLVPGYTKALDLISPPNARYTAGYQYIPAAFSAESIFKCH